MECVNFKICKRLYDNGLLGFNGLDYSWYFRIDSEGNSLAICKHNSNYNEYLEQYIEYPALNSENAIEFIKKSKYNGHKVKIDIQEKYIITYEFKRFDTTTFKEKTLLCCLEKLIEYLLDNNLLQKGEIQELKSQRQIINLQKKELGKKIANLKNKISVYKIRSKYGS